MLELTPEQSAKLGLELATKRQEHSDLEAILKVLLDNHTDDKMLIQRIKKRKLNLKDKIVEIEKIILPDIIA